MTLLDFFRTCPGMEGILNVQEYDRQLVVYVDATAAKEIYTYKGNYFDAIIQRFLPDYFGDYESTEYLSDEAIKALTSININIDKDLYNYESLLKYPYYRAVGHATSTEQKPKNNISNDLYHLQGLINEDGSIKRNAHTGKYPNTPEMLGETLDVLLEYPELDVVIALSEWNDSDDWLKYDDKFIGTDYQDFTSNICIGFWVHNSTIEIMGQMRTAKKLQEYERNNRSNQFGIS